MLIKIAVRYKNLSSKDDTSNIFYKPWNKEWVCFSLSHAIIAWQEIRLTVAVSWAVNGSSNAEAGY